MTRTSHPKAKIFRKCMSEKFNKPLPPKCTDHLKAQCPIRYGSALREQGACKAELEKQRSLGVNTVGGGGSEWDKAFDVYRRCIDTRREETAGCTSILQDQCNSSSLRVIKTIRARMEDAERLLAAHPNLKVVHLLRDPRGVVNSRLAKPWATSLAAKYQGADPIMMEARIYCAEIERDVTLRRRLERRFPGRTTEMVYDHHMANPHQGIADLYRFLGVSLNSDARKHLDAYNSSKPNAWQHKLTRSQVATIDAECKRLFELMPKYW